jgi:hypothetical protein
VGARAGDGYIVLARSSPVAAAAAVRAARAALGVELRLWTASYLVYLLAVFFPQSSIFRLLLPLSPMWGRSRCRVDGWRVGVLRVGCSPVVVDLQHVRAGEYVWQIPDRSSGGGDRPQRDYPLSWRRINLTRRPRRKGAAMAAMKPRTGDGPMEAVKEGRLIIVRVPLEGGGRLVVSVNDAEAKELYDVLGGVVNPA